MANVVPYLTIVAAGIVGMFLLRLLWTRAHLVSAVLAIGWATAFVYFHSQSRERMLSHISSWRPVHTPQTSLALIIVVVGVLSFTWLGLRLCWPGNRKPIGYSLCRTAVWMSLAGIAAGILARAVLWPTVPRTLSGFELLATSPWAWSLLPCAVLEESVFRGRILGELELRMRTSVAILVQALVFVPIHIPDQLTMMHITGIAPLSAVRNLLSVFAVALLLGLFRHKTGNLWMSTFAHAAYNIVTLGVALG